MKMEIENNSQIRWLRQAIGQYLSVQTLNQAIFVTQKGESARIVHRKDGILHIFCNHLQLFCNYFARLPFRKTRNLWFSTANETASPPTNVVICFKISIFASAITTE